MKGQTTAVDRAVTQISLFSIIGRYEIENGSSTIPLEKILYLGGPDILKAYPYKRFRGYQTQFTQLLVEYIFFRVAFFSVGLGATVEFRKVSSSKEGFSDTPWKESYGGGLYLRMGSFNFLVSRYMSKESSVNYLYVQADF